MKRIEELENLIPAVPVTRNLPVQTAQAYLNTPQDNKPTSVPIVPQPIPATATVTTTYNKNQENKKVKLAPATATATPKIMCINFIKSGKIEHVKLNKDSKFICRVGSGFNTCNGFNAYTDITILEHIQKENMDAKMEE